MHLDTKQLSKYTEADVVVQLCSRLLAMGIRIKCEVKLPSGLHRSGYMRADVCVMNGTEIVCAIEVKDSPSDFSNHIGRQVAAYRNLGIPVVWVHGMDDVNRAVQDIKYLRNWSKAA